MRTIHKYELIVDDSAAIEMPVGAEILAVQTQFNRPHLWARVDPNASKEWVDFCGRGTGHEMRGNEGRYIGTFQLDGGALVFHVFEEVS